MQFTREQIEAAVVAKGYKWFRSGDYNLNIVGVRNSATNDKITNKFDDWITVSYKVNGLWKYHEFAATTDPGKHWAENLLNASGVAILVPNQYRGSHKIGLHQGKYEALRQAKAVQVYRDSNLDLHYDENIQTAQVGVFGINVHRASRTGTSTQIDRWSAGCQVIANNENFAKLMSLAKKSEALWGNSFTYTLIESADIA